MTALLNLTLGIPGLVAIVFLLRALGRLACTLFPEATDTMSGFEDELLLGIAALLALVAFALMATLVGMGIVGLVGLVV